MSAMSFVLVAQDKSLYGNPVHSRAGRDAGSYVEIVDRRGENPSLHGVLDVLQPHRFSRNGTCQGSFQTRLSTTAGIGARIPPPPSRDRGVGTLRQSRQRDLTKVSDHHCDYNGLE